MDTVQDLDLAHGAEVEIEIGNGGIHHVVPPTQTQPRPPSFLTSVFDRASGHVIGSLHTTTAAATVSRSALPGARIGYCTSGPTRVTPSGVQLDPGPSFGTATSVTHTGSSYMAPPVPTASLGGWHQPGFLPGFGQQFPWPSAYPLVSVTYMLRLDLIV